jgi:phospholipid/cholesterol/gamma-HCH transport system ATP-binding protein
MHEDAPPISVTDLTIAFNEFVLLRDLNFTINRGDIFIIMGVSGCGKSTLLRLLMGLKEPAKGTVLYGTTSFWDTGPEQRDRLMRGAGVLYQSGALWSAMTLAENVSMPLRQYTALNDAEISEMVSLKLALVDLAGFDDYYPAQLSGGMKKRAGIARALALDPDILFFDEPSSGLDPVNSKLLDDLILQLRDSLGSTIVVISHDLASIFAIGTDSVLLDPDAKTIIARGDPKMLLSDCHDNRVQAFLRRGVKDHLSRTEQEKNHEQAEQ